MAGLVTDLRYVLRVLARSPGFTLVAVLSLALGIGTNGALFGTITNMLRDPLPVQRPEQLVIAYWARSGDLKISQVASSSYRDPASGESYRSNFSYPLYRSMRDAAPGAQLFAFNFVNALSVAAGDQPAVVAGGAFADGRYFTVLQPPMAFGRGLTEADNDVNAPLAAVLGYSFWMRAFGGDRAVLGRTIRVNGVPAEVVGVTGKGFEGLSHGGFFALTDITIPLMAQPRVKAQWSLHGESLLTADDIFWLRVMARVPDHGALPAAMRNLTAAFRSAPSPANAGASAPPVLLLAPGARGPQPVGADTSRQLWILMGVVGAVLLIACVNLATLMLARGVAREREMAVRRALGSGRTRLIRQTLLEGFVLAVCGTLCGILILFWTRGALASLLTDGLGSSAFGSIALRPAVDARVVALCAALCGGATMLFGLLPALRLAAVDPGAFLKHRVMGGAGPKLMLGRSLIAFQIALTVPLLVGAALLLRTVANLNAVDLGFDPRGLVMFQVDPGYTGRPHEQYPALYADLLQRLRLVPGVRSATLVENALLSGLTSNTSITIDGREQDLYMNAVGPDFVETMGMHLLSGRMPGPQDTPERPSVAALNETAVQQLFGGVSPLGRVLRVGKREVQIIGVVSDSRYDRQRSAVRPTMYDAALQRDGYGGHHIVLRTDAPLARIEPGIRRAVADANRDLPVVQIRTQLEQMARTTGKERVFTQLLAAFGLFALLLASIGLHGVTAYSVSRRTSEIGVRIALGAQPLSVLWLILRQVALLALAGLVVGVPAAIAAGPIVSSLLFGVSANDVLAIAAAALAMLAVASAAGMPPALRAARLHPLTALRAE